MISRTEFEKSLGPETLRGSQIIHIALAFGVTIFFVVVLVLYSFGSPQSEPDEGLIRMLCMALMVMAISAYGVAFLRYKKVITKISFSEPFVSTEGRVYKNVGDIFVVRLRTAQIIRLALFEGVAFFGLVICILSVQNGLLYEQPIYWAAALPALVVVLLVAQTFPTKERMVAEFEAYQQLSSNRNF